MMQPLYLNDPTFLELDDAYRGLKRSNQIHVKTKNPEVTIRDMEMVGFVAIRVISQDAESQTLKLSGSKGKHGPCLYSGKTVTYQGIAFAAVDDDNHVFFRGEAKSVCDKTADVLKFSDYCNLVESKDSPNDKKVDQDEFEESLERLYKRMTAESNAKVERKNFYYSGPFRFLIMNDGTLARRGRCSYIADYIDRAELVKEGLMDLECASEGSPIYFRDLYREKGSVCLLDHFIPIPEEANNPITDLSGLDSISKNFRKKLIRHLEMRKKYFVLIGNEVDDNLGCCPSEEVTEANMLVRSGILDSIAEKVGGNACPVTLYGFRDELCVEGTNFSFKMNKEFRDKAKRYLARSSRSGFLGIIKWLLVIFVVVSLLFAIRQCVVLQTQYRQNSLYEVLQPTTEHEIQVVLFHNRKRCFQCQSMEEFTRDVLQKSFHKEIDSRALKFNTLVIDAPENAQVIEQYGVFAATMFLVSFDKQKIKQVVPLLDATHHYQNEELFKSYIKDEITDFLKE